MTGSLILAQDTVLVAVRELPEPLRRQVNGQDGDFALSRPRTRIPTQIIDGDAALLLAEFRQATTVVEAVLRYCGVSRRDPASTLEAAFPLLERLVETRLLLAADASDARAIQPQLEIGSRFAGTEILACLQTLEDTEVYRVRLGSGELAALKRVRSGSSPHMARLYDREGAVLQDLDGTRTPKLLGRGVEAEEPYLLLSWSRGVGCSDVARQLRETRDRPALLRLCLAILRAYAHLHRQGVVHGDVHPGNVLVEEESVTLVDFGFADRPDLADPAGSAERAGVAFFLDPEFVESLRRQQPPPRCSFLAEQYSIGALLYLLVAGKHTHPFSFERNEMQRQIVEDAPAAFAAQGVAPWPEVEEILRRTLAKAPQARFASVQAVCEAFAGITTLPTKPVRAPAVSAAVSPASAVRERVLARLDLDCPLFRAGLPDAPRACVTYGSGGVAAALHHMACLRNDAKLLALADAWSERAQRDALLEDAWYCPALEITAETVGVISPYHTVSGVHLVRALVAQARGDGRTQQQATDAFVLSSQPACESLDLVLGRSGTLLAAARLLETGRTDARLDLSALRNLAGKTARSIWQDVRADAPIAERRQIRPTGLAHGWAGLLYAALEWSQVSGDPLPEAAEERLDQLSKSAHRADDRMIWHGSAHPLAASWCNGTAGQVQLWLSAHRYRPNDGFLVLAQRAGRHVAETGSRNGSLCCGLAGQAHALLALSCHTGEPRWLEDARSLTDQAADAFAIAASRGEANSDAHSNSLFQGEIAVAVLSCALEAPLTFTPLVLT